MKTIQGEKVCLEPLKLKNVYHMREWGRYESPLFNDYNFPQLDDFEVRKWYDIKILQKNTQSFAVINEEEKTIGFISLKDIRKLLKIASLGITFDANYINKGYGTDAIKTLLKYYFESINMRTIYLDVATHNIRAIKCYEKCGFKIVKKYTIKNNEIKLENIEPKITQNDFIFRGNNLYGYYYKMKLEKRGYKKLLYTQK